MAECQAEIDKFTDVNKLPVDVNHCGGVLSAVQAPFTQTSVPPAPASCFRVR